MEVELVKARPMGPTEKLFHKMQEYGGANVCAISEVRGQFSAEKLRAALKQVAARHALLRSRVEVTDGWPQFVMHERQDLPFVVVEGGSSDTLEQLIASEMATDFYVEPWLWKLTCIRDRVDAERFWLLLSMSHSITDGTAICHAIKELLVEYTAPSTRAASEVASLEPTLESYLNYPVTLRDYFGFTSTLLKKSLFPADQIKPEARVVSSGRKTQTVFRQFSAEFSEQLRSKARAESTTLNGALSAAILFAVAERIGPDHPVRIGMETNVSFRKQYGVPPDQAGPLVSILSAIHKLSYSGQFWELARACRQSILAAQQRNSHFSANHMWEALQRRMSDKARMKYLDGAKLGRLEAVGLSNVGDLDIPAQFPGLTLESLRFTAAQHGFGYSFAFYVLSQGGKLGLNLAFADPVVSRATAVAVMNAVAELLERGVALDGFSPAEQRVKSRSAEQKSQKSPAEMSADRNVA